MAQSPASTEETDQWSTSTSLPISPQPPRPPSPSGRTPVRTPPTPLRGLEKLCAKSGEEFHPDGTPLVEKIYGGKFEGGQAVNFIENPAPVVESTATPIAPEATATPTPFGLGVDAQAVSTTPETRFHEPTSESIASQASAVPTHIAPEDELADDLESETPTHAPDKTE